MNIVRAALAPALFLLAGCVTYPYQTAFDACDAEAGACYRYCEDVAHSDRDYAACHADCEVGANQCFADAYDRYSYGGGAYGGSYYQPSWPWYGRYGAWGPRQGYYFDFGYYSGPGHYDRPRHRNRHRNRRDRGGHDRDYVPPPQNPPRYNRAPEGNDDFNSGYQDRGERRPPPRRRESPPPSAPSQAAPPPASAPPASAPQSSPPLAQPSRSAPPAKPSRERASPRQDKPQDY